MKMRTNLNCLGLAFQRHKVAQQQDALRALGWRVVSSSPEVHDRRNPKDQFHLIYSVCQVIQNLGNKVRLQDYAKAGRFQ